MKKKIIQIKNKIEEILLNANVKKAGIFGSYARGEQKKNSDIDLLIEVEDKEFSLLDLVKLKNALENKLKKEVDLVEYSQIKPLIKKEILKEEQRII